MAKVTVVDGVMGSGKSSWAIQYMNDARNSSDRFIYITPINTEVDRIKEQCPERDFRSTNLDKYNGRKMHIVKEWLQDRANICTTHSLFRSADAEFLAYIRENDYTLILDEAMTVIELADVKKTDIDTLLDAGNIEFTSDGRVVWLKDEYDGRFVDVKAYAKAGTLYHLSGKMFVRSFPEEAFRAFSKVYCLTYLFKAQQQRCYFDLFSIEYETVSVKKLEDGTYELTEHSVMNEGRRELYSLIDVYAGPLNKVGDSRTALSSTWFGRSTTVEDRRALQRATRNYLMNIQKVSVSEALWTTKKAAYKVKGYDGAFAPVNCRGTNDYQHAHALAYGFNRFANPEEKLFFGKYGIELDQDALAVSDLLQWIWRSRIRNGQPIKLYLPSSRMRSLLLAWSKYEI
ncbi:DEAD/DEAH box helicase family protein [Paenibacillus graminis]|uniref:DEAD/DEAH box helicase family protein n=1 Tax=Paenibacillus graminis TaxID=189425 RepID=UPI002DBC7255|nr:DEAD/DEAH box helicase family protein [Paenibacillus graminis]MEC0167495.1 DEAD/DEAH box helicase family protein [Paenibacillus graminis]